MKRSTVTWIGMGILLAAVIAVSVAVARPWARDPAAEAVARLRSSGTAGGVLRPDQLAFLAAAHELFRSRELLDVLRDVRLGVASPGDLQTQLDRMGDQLAPYGRRREDADSAGPGGATGSAEMDRLLGPIQRRLSRGQGRARTFVHTLIPDPRKVTVSLDRQDGGNDSGSNAEDQSGPPGETVVKETTAKDGTEKTVTSEYGPDGQLVRRTIGVHRSDSTSHSSTERRADGVWVRNDVTFGPGPKYLVEWSDYWRRDDENRWRPGNPVNDLAGYQPAEGGGGSGGGGYMMRLRDGTLVGCTVVSPVSGVAVCRELSPNRVNPGPDGGTRVIDAPRLQIDPRDLVINPDPDNPRPRRPGGPPVIDLPRDLGPGGRPPRPEGT